ncbi:hypothetical protein [Halorussus lipolyticus]|uniref:hypothetical protein n=1 Tax=Halorussus lipolyticus TaxID=3034024 RepID=UPI0023E7F410|nr:hypothetical protein [Halorussus sp. DT80]
MNRERRAVLKGIGALVAGAAGGGTAAGNSGAVGDGRRKGGAVGSNAEETPRGATNQQVDTSLSPGVTLFDLNDDGEYAARVESAPDEVRDDAHPDPIHVTSDGNSTVDYAASIAAPDAETTLGGLTDLTYDYYAGPDDTGIAPDQTFVVVENDDGRHGMYLTVGAGGSAERWTTFDVLSRMTGSGSGQWFEYTAIEEDYDGETFGNVVERFGDDALLVRVGVGHGDAVNPVVLDLFYDNLVVNGSANRFPTSVAKRVSNAQASSLVSSNAPPF